MKDFNWTAYTKKIAIRASIADTYDAWTKSDALEKWFLQKAEFYNAMGTRMDANTPAQAGTRYNWLWYLYKDPMEGIIKAVNGKDHLQFTFEGECLVDVDLREENGYTIVELRHHNIPLDDHSRQFVRLGCSNGWTFYLANLKSVLEGGIDLRNKDENLVPMINN